MFTKQKLYQKQYYILKTTKYKTMGLPTND